MINFSAQTMNVIIGQLQRCIMNANWLIRFLNHRYHIWAGQRMGKRAGKACSQKRWEHSTPSKLSTQNQSSMKNKYREIIQSSYLISVNQTSAASSVSPCSLTLVSMPKTKGVILPKKNELVNII